MNTTTSIPNDELPTEEAIAHPIKTYKQQYGRPYPDDPQICDINMEVARKCDKFFRMYSGASTCLIGLEDGVFTLETRISHRNQGEQQLWFNIAAAWLVSSSVLQKCHTCHIRIFKRSAPTGFATSPKEHKKKTNKELAGYLVEALKNSFDADKNPHTYLGEFTFSVEELKHRNR